MARKYKRDASGRFAGGGGGSSKGGGGAKSASPKKATPAQRKVVAKRPKGRKLPMHQRVARGATKGTVKGLKWVKKNPRKAIAIAYGASVVHHNIKNKDMLRQIRVNLRAAEQIKNAQNFARSKASDKRGLGTRPGVGLKPAKRNLRGSYKIRS